MLAGFPEPDFGSSSFRGLVLATSKPLSVDNTLLLKQSKALSPPIVQGCYQRKHSYSNIEARHTTVDARNIGTKIPLKVFVAIVPIYR